MIIPAAVNSWNIFGVVHTFQTVQSVFILFPPLSCIENHSRSQGPVLLVFQGRIRKDPGDKAVLKLTSLYLDCGFMMIMIICLWFIVILPLIQVNMYMKLRKKMSKGRAANNGRSTDNVRSKIDFVRANPQLAGQFVRSFTLVRKKLRVSSLKYLKVQYYWRL